MKLDLDDCQTQALLRAIIMARSCFCTIGPTLSDDDLAALIELQAGLTSPPLVLPTRAQELEAARAMLAALVKAYEAYGNNQERHGMNGDDTWTDADHIEWQDAAPDMRAAIDQARKLEELGA